MPFAEVKAVSKSLRMFSVFAAILSAGPGGFAAPEAQPPRITVRLYNFAGVSDGVLDRAEGISTQIFHDAGIRIIWTPCPRNSAERNPYPNCREPFGPSDIILRILPAAPEKFSRRRAVFGVAWLGSGTEISTVADVYYDRVQQMTSSSLRSASRGIFSTQLAPDVCDALTLGAVLSHEIGHLLLGTNSHSTNGIMRAAWSRRDLEKVYFDRLHFTSNQENRLRAEVHKRSLIEAES